MQLALNRQLLFQWQFFCCFSRHFFCHNGWLVQIICFSIMSWCFVGVKSGLAAAWQEETLQKSKDLSASQVLPLQKPQQTLPRFNLNEKPAPIGSTPIAPPPQVRSSNPSLAAAPNNLNPDLQLPPPRTVLDAVSSPAFTEESGLQLDFRSDSDNFGQQNRWLEQTLRFRLDDENMIRFTTGLNLFDQPYVEPVVNVPLQVGWDGDIGRVSLHAAVGIDLFDRLSPALNIEAQVDAPILPNVTLSGVVEQGAYKANAQTLENQITALRVGPNVYWQIDPNTSLFSLLRLGNYNDGNEELQSFSRLEHRFGDFFVAANLFTWSYTEDLQNTSGYFSPPDFLVYSGELGWEGNITDFLRCRLTANLGQQRLVGDWNMANSYQTKCTVQFSPDVELDLGYTYSNVQNRAANNYRNDSFLGQVRIQF
jgi:hypothetical protein